MKTPESQQPSLLRTYHGYLLFAHYSDTRHQCQRNPLPARFDMQTRDFDFAVFFIENQIDPYDLTSQYGLTTSPYTSQSPHQAYAQQYSF